MGSLTLAAGGTGLPPDLLVSLRQPCLMRLRQKTRTGMADPNGHCESLPFWVPILRLEGGPKPRWMLPFWPFKSWRQNQLTCRSCSFGHEHHDMVYSILFLHVFTSARAGSFSTPRVFGVLRSQHRSNGMILFDHRIIDVKICDSKSSQVC